jgi:hypothetical protein
LKKVPVLALLFLATVASASAQSTFKANFELRRPDTNGAVVHGSMTYDRPNYRMLLEYSNPGQFREILKFNPSFGVESVSSLVAASQAIATDDQWKYRIGDTCEGCSATQIGYAMPVYVNDSAIYQATGGPGIVVGGSACGEYAPQESILTPLTRAWFTQAGLICRALWNDGSEYTFTSVTGVSTNSISFDEPAQCGGCAEQHDIIILIDRSGSISGTDYDAAKIAARNLAHGFTVSPSQANVAIAQFDTDVEFVMDLYQGVSYLNIDAALNTMSPVCSGTLDYSLRPQEAPVGVPVNCGRRTSISKALLRSSQYLATNSRVGARRSILVITDGRANTLADTITPCVGGACNDDITGAIETVTAAHPGIEIFGVGMGNTDRRKMALFKGGHFGRLTPSSCSEPNACDATACSGLCECTQCVAPAP